MNKEELLAKIKMLAKTKVVHVPEWDTDVTLKMLSGTERERMEHLLSNSKNIRAEVIAMSVVDEDGKRVVNTTADVAMLGNSPCVPLIFLYNEILQFNAVRKEDIEQIEKN